MIDNKLAMKNKFLSLTILSKLKITSRSLEATKLLAKMESPHVEGITTATKNSSHTLRCI